MSDQVATAEVLSRIPLIQVEPHKESSPGLNALRKFQRIITPPKSLIAIPEMAKDVSAALEADRIKIEGQIKADLDAARRRARRLYEAKGKLTLFEYSVRNGTILSAEEIAEKRLDVIEAFDAVGNNYTAEKKEELIAKAQAKKIADFTAIHNASHHPASREEAEMKAKGSDKVETVVKPLPEERAKKITENVRAEMEKSFNLGPAFPVLNIFTNQINEAAADLNVRSARARTERLATLKKPLNSSRELGAEQRRIYAHYEAAGKNVDEKTVAEINEAGNNAFGAEAVSREVAAFRNKTFGQHEHVLSVGEIAAQAASLRAKLYDAQGGFDEEQIDSDMAVAAASVNKTAAETRLAKVIALAHPYKFGANEKDLVEAQFKASGTPVEGELATRIKTAFEKVEKIASVIAKLETLETLPLIVNDTIVEPSKVKTAAEPVIAEIETILGRKLDPQLERRFKNLNDRAVELRERFAELEGLESKEYTKDDKLPDIANVDNRIRDLRHVIVHVMRSATPKPAAPAVAKLSYDAPSEPPALGQKLFDPAIHISPIDPAKIPGGLPDPVIESDIPAFVDARLENAKANLHRQSALEKLRRLQSHKTIYTSAEAAINFGAEIRSQYLRSLPRPLSQSARDRFDGTIGEQIDSAIASALERSSIAALETFAARLANAEAGKIPADNHYRITTDRTNIITLFQEAAAHTAARNGPNAQREQRMKAARETALDRKIVGVSVGDQTAGVSVRDRIAEISARAQFLSVEALVTEVKDANKKDGKWLTPTEAVAKITLVTTQYNDAKDWVMRTANIDVRKLIAVAETAINSFVRKPPQAPHPPTADPWLDRPTVAAPAAAPAA